MTIIYVFIIIAFCSHFCFDYIPVSFMKWDTLRISFSSPPLQVCMVLVFFPFYWKYFVNILLSKNRIERKSSAIISHTHTYQSKIKEDETRRIRRKKNTKWIVIICTLLQEFWNNCGSIDVMQSGSSTVIKKHVKVIKSGPSTHLLLFLYRMWYANLAFGWFRCTWHETKPNVPKLIFKINQKKNMFCFVTAVTTKSSAQSQLIGLYLNKQISMLTDAISSIDNYRCQMNKVCAFFL